MRWYLRAASIIFRPSHTLMEGFFFDIHILARLASAYRGKACQCSGVAITTASTSLSSKICCMAEIRCGALAWTRVKWAMDVGTAIIPDVADILEFPPLRSATCHAHGQHLVHTRANQCQHDLVCRTLSRCNLRKAVVADACCDSRASV